MAQKPKRFAIGFTGPNAKQTYKSRAKIRFIIICEFRWSRKYREKKNKKKMKLFLTQPSVETVMTTIARRFSRNDTRLYNNNIYCQRARGQTEICIYLVIFFIRFDRKDRNVWKKTRLSVIVNNKIRVLDINCGRFTFPWK